MKRPRPVVLCILDGWGLGEKNATNAVNAARTPNLDKLEADYPTTSLDAAGEAVGLPPGQMGNSEVGHLNIGAGRVVYQDITRISKAVKDGDFFHNEVLLDAVRRAKEGNRRLHLMGLLSDGGVHSSWDHVEALLKLAADSGVERLYFHAFLDGRDVPPRSALKYFSRLEEKMSQLGTGRVATVSGRYYAMDRDKRWERTKLAFDALTKGEGATASSAAEAVRQSYDDGVVDEFVKPTVILEEGNPVAEIERGDSVIFLNFRNDRTRQLTQAITQENFDGFDRGDWPRVHFVCMTLYDPAFNLPVAFPKPRIINTLADVLAANGSRQLHIAETEKYAHVTFFFNGQVEQAKDREERILVPSPKVATYDMKPEMSAYEVTDKVVKEITEDGFDFVVMNYANCDMVGHTGKLDAAIGAVEAVDECVGRLVHAALSVGGAVFITADHGNADKMLDFETGQPHTAHTTDPVPFIAVCPDKPGLRDGGILSDIGPTILGVMGIEQPEEMTGKNLFLR
ncbi:MAG: 2,3-bisphosphoglycerate-independent phosphoglycerate mutase [Chloroflexi bacterium]|nr:2,3-bisphosphoglycerate-independent phosphoglycerate mutase [Chloroflexota bacterium]